MKSAIMINIKANSRRKFLRITLILFLTTLSLNCSLAQINTESLRRNIDETGAYHSLSVAVNLKKGNTEKAEYIPGYRFDYIGKKHYFYSLGMIDYEDTHIGIVSSKGLVYAKNEFLVPFFIHPEVFVQYNQDEKILLKNRFLGGANGRVVIVKTELDSLKKSSLGIYFGFGAMWEYEEISSTNPYSTKYFRSNNYLNIIWRLYDRVDFQATGYFQTPFEKIEHYRILSDVGFNFKISKIFRFAVNLNYRYDNLPPAELKKFDMTLSSGFALEF